MAQADRDGMLADALKPVLRSEEQSVAEIEGWILGVPIPPRDRKPVNPSRQALSIANPLPKSPTTTPGYVNRNGQRVVRETVATHDMKLGKLAQPVRVAVTGGTASPGIFEVLALLGRDTALARLGAARARIAA